MMPDLNATLDRLIQQPDPVMQLVTGAPRVNIHDQMVERCCAVAAADPEAMATNPRDRTAYLEESAAVLAYRDRLEGAEREAFEGDVVMRVGARAVNEFFGYHRRLDAVQREIQAKKTIQEREDALKARTSPLLTQVRQNARESRKKRKTRRVVGDWLESTRAAMKPAPEPMGPESELGELTKNFMVSQFLAAGGAQS